MVIYGNLIKPHEQPSLAVALRIDESGSMVREDRMIAAKS